MPNVRPFLMLAALAATTLAMPPARAETDTADMAVSAEVVTGCTVTANPMRFGSLFGVTGSARMSAAIHLRCSPNTAYGVEMDYGQNRQGNNRRMHNPVGNRYLRYRIFADAAYSQQWDDRPRRQVSGNTGPTGMATLTAYGEIPSVTNLAASGTYSDTVVVTVQF